MMAEDKVLEDARDRLTVAERRLRIARIDRDHARESVRRAKENVVSARKAMREADARLRK